ncbi:unnamed protein product [Closterium sp. NIES-64]|nr:unnamed protein product [Closterium sp. NIES-64]
MDHRPPSLAHPNKRIQLLPPSDAADGTIVSTPIRDFDMESGMGILRVKGRVKSLDSISHGSASAATKTRNAAAEHSRKFDEPPNADGGKSKALASIEEGEDQADGENGVAKKEKKKKLRCSFCDQTSSDESTGALVAVDEKGVAFELAGDLSPNEICVHEDCLLWSPEVHFTKGRFVNVQKELRRSGGSLPHHPPPHTSSPFRSFPIPCSPRLPLRRSPEDAYVLSCPQHPPVGAKPKKLKRKQPSPPAAPAHADDSDDEEDAGNAQDARRGKEDARAPPVAGKNQRRARTGAGGRGAGAGGRKTSAQGAATVAPEVPVTKDVTGAVKDVTMKDVTTKAVAAVKSKEEDAARAGKASAPIAKVPVTKNVTMKGVTLKDEAAGGKKTEESMARVGKECRSVERGKFPVDREFEGITAKKDKGKGVEEGDSEQETERGVSFAAANALAPCSSSKKGQPCPNDSSPKPSGSVASVSLADDASAKLMAQARVTKADSGAVFKVPQPVVKVPQAGASVAHAVVKPPLDRLAKGEGKEGEKERKGEGDKGDEGEGSKEVEGGEGSLLRRNEGAPTTQERGKEKEKKQDMGAGVAGASAAAAAEGGSTSALSGGGVTAVAAAAAAAAAAEVAVTMGARKSASVAADGASCSRNSGKPPRNSGKPFSQWVLCGSALDSASKARLVKFADAMGAQLTSDWSPRVTHLLVGTDSEGKARRTLKMVMAILHGQWVLSSKSISPTAVPAEGPLELLWLPSSPTAASLASLPAEGPFEVLCDSHDESGGATRGRLHYAAALCGCTMRLHYAPMAKGQLSHSLLPSIFSPPSSPLHLLPSIFSPPSSPLLSSPLHLLPSIFSPPSSPLHLLPSIFSPPSSRTRHSALLSSPSLLFLSLSFRPRFSPSMSPIQPMAKGHPSPPPLFASITAPIGKGHPLPPPLFASITAVFLEGGFLSPSFADVASILQCGGGTVIPSSALQSPTAKTLLAAFSNPSNTTNSTTIAAEKRRGEEGETKILLVVYADVPANTPSGSGKMRRELALVEKRREAAGQVGKEMRRELALVEKRREAAGQLGKEVGARACVTHNWIIDSAAAFELKPF